MNAKVETFESDWIGLSLTVRKQDIDMLIDRLTELRNQEVGHFHIRRDDSSDKPDVADIEFSLENDDAHQMLRIE